MIEIKRMKTLSERIVSKLGPPDPDTGCIEWTGCRNNFNYGKISNEEGKTVYAHRLVYELKYGPIPKGMVVLHRCDNPPCCNEDHLFLGTKADNSSDMKSKGRQWRPTGEKNKKARLTEADVIEIRRRLATGKETIKEISRSFGVALPTIDSIKAGRNWSHVKNPEDFEII
jgi:hypothetical protein